jgi:hypothetical protein
MLIKGLEFKSGFNAIQGGKPLKSHISIKAETVPRRKRVLDITNVHLAPLQNKVTEANNAASSVCLPKVPKSTRP